MSHTEDEVEEVGEGVDVRVTWQLSEKWGVGRDPYNWILYGRTTKGKWKVVGYFGSPGLLTQGLKKKIELTEEVDDLALCEYLEKCNERLWENVNVLLEKIRAEYAGLKNDTDCIQKQ